MTTLKKAAQADVKNYLERIERLEEERKELGDDIRAIYAEAKAAGFDTKAIRGLVKLRKKDATERAEEEAMLETYMHAVGMAVEAPLFAAVGAMGTDTAAREQVIEAFKLLVPSTGEIIVKMGGNPVRLWRDDKGEPHAEDYVEAKPAAEKPGKSLKKPATVLSMVPGGKTPGLSEAEIKRIADDAEERGKIKGKIEEPAPEPQPV